MKQVLRYILPFLFFVALMGRSEAVANEHMDHEPMVESVASVSRISTDLLECILAEPTSSVLTIQRVQNGSRQLDPEQKRCGASIRFGRTAHPCLHDNNYINQHVKSASFPVPVHRLIRLGKLII